MKSPLLSPLLVAWLFAAAPGQAAASYPDRPVRIVVPAGPGSGADTLARMLSETLFPKANQPVIVDNKPGAGGSIAAQAVAQAPADGYTLLLGTSSTHGINPWVYARLPYDVVRDFAPISMLALSDYAVVVNPAVLADVKSIEDLVTRARSRRTTYASSGNGSTSHLASALLGKITGVEFVHVPYKSSAAAAADVMGGHADFMIDNVSVALPNVTTGKLRMLATSGKLRSAVVPDVPTLAEAGVPGYEMMGWWVLVAPGGTPPAVVEALGLEVNRIVATPEVRSRIAAIGNQPFTTSPEQTRIFMAQELGRYRIAVEAAGAKIE